MSWNARPAARSRATITPFRIEQTQGARQCNKEPCHATQLHHRGLLQDAAWDESAGAEWRIEYECGGREREHEIRESEDWGGGGR